MQLRLNIDELKLLVEIVEGCERELRTEMALNPESGAKLKLESCERLLDRLAARDLGLGYDELEDLMEIVICHKRRFRVQLARQSAFEHLLDKVTEACAMA